MYVVLMFRLMFYISMYFMKGLGTPEKTASWERVLAIKFKKT